MRIISEQMTERELEIMSLLASGMTYTDIGRALHISVNTVKYHVSMTLQKTGFRNTISLVAYMSAKGMIELEVS